ncbi:MAG TPA: S8 family peptidase [Actinomycetota bacterium]|nr:S8 family peptidase [Actinomycetota bacterium]
MAIAVAAVVTAGAPTANAAADGPRGSLALPTSFRAPVVPRELVVVFDDDVGAPAARAIHRAAGADPAGGARALGIDVVRVPRGRSIAAAVKAYERDARVVSVEPNLRRFPALVPTDTSFRHQWGMRNTGQRHAASFGGSHRGRSDADTDAHDAWDVTTGEPTDPADRVVVAVIDSGVDIDHPDLAGAIWTNEDEIPNDGEDNDGNGYVDDVNGWDFEGRDRNPNPPPGESHGTHVAGVVAAQLDGQGVVGMCPGCRIMPLRFGFTIGQEIQAIRYAVANGATVINMSYSGPVWSAAERAAIEAAGDAGVLVVAAAGNDSLDNDVSAFMPNRDASPSFPASYDLPEIVSVAASTDRDVYGYGSFCDRRGLPAWVCAFTSWGRVSVDVAAPGVDVTSTVVAGSGPGGGDHDTWDGTSMAAPHVAGVAGLVRTVRPTLTPVEVKNAILNGVDRPASLRLASFYRADLGLPPGPIAGRFTQTQGRLDALGALTAGTTRSDRGGDGTIRGARPFRRTAVGRVGWPGDVNDVFAKRLRASTRYRLVLDGRGGADLDLFVWNPGTEDVWQFDAGCFHVKGTCLALRAASTSPDADETLTFRSRREGLYFVHVSAWFSGSRYRIALRRV